MKRAVAFVALLAVIVAAAAGLRLASLDNRAMHCDEAGQALKFGRLLERGEYVFDPYEYHGPSLNYLTLPVARLAGADKLTELDEKLIRLLPAVFGIILVGLIWLVRDELGHVAALSAAAFTAVSPAMVFYSRYYIQEMLLVCFTFGAIAALWRYRREVIEKRRLRQWAWLVLLGLCLGMMHATKETCVIPMFAIGVAALALGPLSLWERVRVRGFGSEGGGFVEDQNGIASDPHPRPVSQRERGENLGATAGLSSSVNHGLGKSTAGQARSGTLTRLLPALIVIVSAACVSMLLFSSFLDNPRGVLDSITTYSHYFQRASGEGSAGPHDHPWYYYLQVLFWWHYPGGPVWTEAAVAAFALAGLIAAVLRRGIATEHLPAARFMAVYTVLMTVIYSALPYKTPWCALGFYHGMILLAGVGAAVLIGATRSRLLKAAMILLLAAAIGQLGWQTWRTSFVDCQDPGNPYVYAHTTGDVPLLAERVEQVAAAHADAGAMHIQVICPDDDHWPLPWYLRRLTRVDWFSQVADGPAAPLIITQPEMEPALLKKLYDEPPPGQRYLYVPLLPDGDGRDWQLRPGVPLRVYLRLDLWNAYNR